MTRCLCTLAFLLCLTSIASAQVSTPAIPTQFQLLILPPTGDPLTVMPVNMQTTAIGPTQNCGIDPATVSPPAQAPVINPLLFTLADPFTAGKVCRLSFPTALNAGNYQWAGIFVAASCTPGGGPVVTPCPGPRAVGQPPFSVVNPVTPPGAPSDLMLRQ